MLIRKPADDDRGKIAPRSGHGAASVIPHINHEPPRPRLEDDDEFSAGAERSAPTPPGGNDRDRRGQRGQR